LLAMASVHNTSAPRKLQSGDQQAAQIVHVSQSTSDTGTGKVMHTHSL
jgi:hypothetical protein